MPKDNKMLDHDYSEKQFVYDVNKLIAENDFCSEEIIIHYKEGKPVFWVNCSDLHWWGVGYGVQLVPEDLPILKGCLDIDSITGHLLFCCKNYEMRPQGAYYEYLDSDMWLEFDKCGPIRQSGFMNPHMQKFNDETWNYNLEHYANEMFEYMTYPWIDHCDHIMVGDYEED